MFSRQVLKTPFDIFTPKWLKAGILTNLPSHAFQEKIKNKNNYILPLNNVYLSFFSFFFLLILSDSPATFSSLDKIF